SIQTQLPAVAGALSALDVGELLGDLAVPEAQHVGSSHVPGPVVPGPVEAPAQDSAVAADERLLLGERRVRSVAEHVDPDRADRVRTLVAYAVRRWSRRLEDAVVAHQRHDRVD